MSFKIHPAIGIARLGNSPTDFFVGPETADEPAPPAGGYKDASCRVKRQAARFRIWQYDNAGNPIKEITSADATIEWTVALGNRKAALGNRNTSVTGADRDGLAITPSAATVSGPNEVAKLDDGVFKLPSQPAVSVPLGEIRTEGNARLLVLGGFGKSSSPTGAGLSSYLNNDAWHDDVADGPIKARIKLNGSATWEDAEGAWVIVGPPDFAPAVGNAITLHDRLTQYFIDKGLLPADNSQPQFRRHILPVLKAAFDVRGVYGTSAHTTLDPSLFPLSSAARDAVFQKLRSPAGGGGNMPMLGNSPSVTSTQYGFLEKWKNGNFVDDWGTPPGALPLTPSELDRGPLFHSVGAAFFPGIEAGDFLIPGTASSVWASPFRIDHTKVKAGDVGSVMACPWQADFTACGGSWWPGQRPDQVTPQGASSRVDWRRGIGSYEEMVLKWPTLGYVVRQNTGLVEVERCDTASILLLTPALHFTDVPQGSSGLPGFRLLPIELDVSTPSVAATFRFKTGPVQAGLSRYYVNSTSTDVVVPATGAGVTVTARLWVLYQTGAVGSVVGDQVTVEHVESGQTWQIVVTANTVARQSTKVALVLDHSLSMLESAGSTLNKNQALAQAASIFVDLAQEGDGIGVVQFNHDSSIKLGVTKLGPPVVFDQARTTVKGALVLTPAGSTSVGDGIDRGRQVLAASPDPYDRQALVVLTDGKENNPLWISDVSGQIDATTYAIGLGEANNVNVSALQTVTGNTGGYFLLTGGLGGDNAFRLSKYFLQILAGITNAEVVLDPDGYLIPGIEERIPFALSDAELGADVILLTPYPKYVDFQLETPFGDRITPATTLSLNPVEHLASDNVAYYRVRLPAEVVPQRPVHAGTWHAVLSVGRQRTATGMLAMAATHMDQQPNLRRFPYSLVVHAYSGVSLRATLSQNSREPGAIATLDASLLQFGVPFEGNSSVFAEVTAPDGARSQLAFARLAPGRYRATFPTTRAGIYRFRVRASGQSRGGWTFQREQTLTAVTVVGGDVVRPPNGSGGGDGPSQALCDLLTCWVRGGGLRPEGLEQLRRLGFDLELLLKCLAASCKRRAFTPEALREMGVATTRASGAAAYGATPAAAVANTSALAALEAILMEAAPEAAAAVEATATRPCRGC